MAKQGGEAPLTFLQPNFLSLLTTPSWVRSAG